MAKLIEEHLYRAALTKEEYLDFNTLGSRLQAVARRLDLHRAGSASSLGGASNASHQSLTPGASQPNGMQDTGGDGGSGLDVGGHNMAWNAGQAAGSQSQTMQGPNMGQMGAAQSSQVANMAGAPSKSHLGMNFDSNQQASSNLSIGNNSGSDEGARQNSSWTPGTNAMQNMDGPNINSGAIQQLHASFTGAGGTQTANQSINSTGFSVLQAMRQQQTSGGPGSMEQFGQQHASWGVGQAQTGQSQGVMGTSSMGAMPDQDSAAAQKKRVLLQQQKRLLLLRHASKCTAGESCPTKCCGQMITLWRHMKSCRDRNCSTSHCLSSRCVLNHYRICKSNGKTATCEVCGPVMSKIKELEQGDASLDPLFRESDSSPALAGASAPANAPPHNVARPNQDDQSQNQQLKLLARLKNLQQLQEQQKQLQLQQQMLSEKRNMIGDQNSQQCQQLTQQQHLLSELQRRCVQQEALMKNELRALGFQSQTNQAAEIPGSVTVPQPVQQGLMMAAPAPALEPTSVPRESVPSTGPPNRKGSTTAPRRGSGIGKAMKKLTQTVPNTQKASKKRNLAVASDNLKKKAKATDEAKQLSAQTRPEDVNTSLVAYMTKEEISCHLKSLNKKVWMSSRTVTHKCLPIVQELIDHQFGWVFAEAVDPVALGLPDYFDVVKKPMHLELVKKKLENAIYADMDSFERDARLVFENAILYNGEDSEVGNLAQTMLSELSTLYQDVVKGIESSQQHLESKGDACSLCGVQKRKFEPTVLYCQGKCAMQRIKRKASYFTDRTKQNHWCDKCYAELEPNESVVLDDGSEVFKKDLQEFKNDAVPEEGWVNCDSCKSWVHQICALFNGRTNKANATYTCPNCYLATYDVMQPKDEDKKLVKGASDLPVGKMSTAIEGGLMKAMEAAYEERAKDLGVSLEEVEKAEGLSVRVLSNVEKNHLVGDKVGIFFCFYLSHTLSS